MSRSHHLKNVIATAVLHGESAVRAYLESLGDAEFYALFALIRRVLRDQPDHETSVVYAFSVRYGYMLSCMEGERDARAALV